jgi:hypothetical protein
MNILDISRCDNSGTVLIASVALILSFFSTVAALISVGLQRTHNRKSVTPYPDIIFADYEDRIGVYLVNKGLGPMIIKEFEVYSGCKWVKDRLSGGELVKNNLIDLLPPGTNGILWNDFTKVIKKRVVAPGEKMVIVELIGNPKSKKYASFRDNIRTLLKPLYLLVHYKGIYGQKMPILERSLEWFGRSKE